VLGVGEIGLWGIKRPWKWMVVLGW